MTNFNTQGMISGEPAGRQAAFVTAKKQHLNK